MAVRLRRETCLRCPRLNLLESITVRATTRTNYRKGSQMKPFHYTDVALLTDEADDMADTNPFRGMGCYVIDYHASEMSGADCVVAYYAASKESFRAKLIANGVSEEYVDRFIDDGGGYEYMVEKKGIELPPGRFYFVCPGYKGHLKPSCSAGALKLLSESIDGWKYVLDGPKGKVDEGWFHTTYVPYKCRKLGQVLLNCADMVSLSQL